MNQLDLNIEDIENGSNEWLNIQDIIRKSFISFTNCINNQNNEIKILKEKLENKIDKNVLDNEWNDKINKDDLKENLKEINNKLDEKLNIKNYEINNKNLIKNNEFELHKKIIEEKLKLFENNLSLKIDKNENQLKLNRILENYNILKEDVNKCIKLDNFNTYYNELKEELSEKISLPEIKTIWDDKIDYFSLQKELEKKLNKDEFENFIMQKADVEDIDKIIYALEKKSDNVDIEKIYKILEKKTNKNDFFKLEREVEKKIPIKNFESLKTNFNNLKLDFEKYSLTLNKKIDVIKNNNSLYNENLNKISKEIDSKINIKEFKLIKNQFEDKLNKQQVTLLLKSFENEVKIEFSNQLKLFKNEIYNQNEENINFNNITKNNFNKNNSDIENINIIIENIIKDKSKEINDIQNLIRNNSIKLKNDFNSKIEIYQKEYESIKEKLQNLIDNNLSLTEYLKFKNDINKDVKSKVNLSELQNVISNYQLEVSEKLINLKQDIKNLLKNKDNDFKKFLSNKVDKNVFQKNLDSKIDKEQFENIILEYVKNEEIQNLYRKYELINENDNNFNLMNEQWNILKENFTNFSKNLSLKGDLKDICELLDQKVNIEEVNKEFTKIYSNLNNLSSKNELKNFINEQGEINEFLCTENILVRYKWKSGNLLNGSFVPWENMIVNTLPDNFILESNKYSILISTTGLYEIIINFYSSNKPNFTLLVNGEVITQSIIKQNSKIIQLKGNKIVEYLLLPARTNISVMYKGDSQSEGFINIKRL